ncbi:MAG: ACP S-malonyltransferase [Thermodesulfovibrionales bacterium]|nr:ACP S-malonyltransferase [Thermodesulfovibrionales bacterium]
MIAFVFPGQGSQYVGMGKDLYDNFPEVRDIFREASDTLGYDMTRLCFEGPKDLLDKTSKTQPAILTVSIACLRLMELKGKRPDVVAGHSLGEYTACVAAGVLSFKDCLRIVEKRGIFMEQAVPEGKGLMAAILGLERAALEEVLRSVSSGYVTAANFNCPGQIVISGEKEAVLEAVEISREKGAKKAVPLQVSVPSHSKLMLGASEQLAQILKEFNFNDAKVPVVSNVDGRSRTSGAEIKEALVRQLYSSVLWEDSVRNIYGEGINIFVEIGPGKVLSGLIRRIVSDATILNIEDKNTFLSTLEHI